MRKELPPWTSELFDYVAERAEVLATADSSKQETKDAAAAWKQADNAAVEAATKTLVDYLDGRPNTIDAVIAFAEGPAKQLMGEEVAAAMAAEQKQRKEQGAKWCGCPSCTAASEILAKFGRCELELVGFCGFAGVAGLRGSPRAFGKPRARGVILRLRGKFAGQRCA